MATTYLHVTPAGADTKNGTTWATAMGLAEFKTSIEALGSPVDYTYFIKEGQYTFTADIFASGDGAEGTPCFIIGVKSATTNEGANVVPSDYADGNARPEFVCGGYTFGQDNYWKIFNIRATGTDTDVLTADLNALYYNCSAINSSITAGRGAFNVYTTSTLVGCYGESTNGNAFLAYSGSVMFGCYAADSDNGLIITQGGQHVSFCIFDSCTTGINLVNFNNNTIINNTIYNCTTGIKNTTGGTPATSYNNLIMNSIINDCTTGVDWFAKTESNLWINNNFEGNGDDWATGDEPIMTNLGETAVDPQFTTPGSDFSLGSGSGCIDAGKSIELGVG